MGSGANSVPVLWGWRMTRLRSSRGKLARPYIRGSPESVDTLIQLIFPVPLLLSCHVTAGAPSVRSVFGLVSIQASGLGVAAGDRWLRFSGGRGVAVVAVRGFRDDCGL
jgi:hypothetical protein